VVARLLHHGKLPAGVNQFEWGKQQVKERFGEVSVMFLVDQMVRRVVGRFSRQVMRAARWIPGKFGRRVSNMVSRLLRFSTNYIDEAILARSFWREEGVWQGARDGLILYAMSWRTLLPNALALMLLSYVPVMGMVLILVIPVGLLLSVVSGDNGRFRGRSGPGSGLADQAGPGRQLCHDRHGGRLPSRYPRSGPRLPA
jgi:hypothetical protein